jgi:DNA repair protein RecO (recombination protein O)
MRSFKTEGIIIKRKNYGEADRFLTILTPRHGKIKILAKGVRKISSRRSSHIELLNLSYLSIHESRMPILTEVEAINHFENLKSDLDKSAYAFYVCELVDGLLAEHQENRQAYDLLRQVLYDLEIDPDPRKKIKKFEQDILILLGFWPKERVFAQDQTAFIEEIMERRIKTKRILPSVF